MRSLKGTHFLFILLSAGGGLFDSDLFLPCPWQADYLLIAFFIASSISQQTPSKLLSISASEKRITLKSIFVQHIGSGFVIQLSIHSIVLISVKFNNKLCTMAIKVDDKVINYALLIYFHGIMLQKIIPQMFFPTRHIPSQTFCDIKQIIIFLYTRFVVHFTLSVTTSSRHLSRKERLSNDIFCIF